MGTRGFVGFVTDGEEKITYNHWDSYPSGLGATVLAWLRDKVANEPVNLRKRATQLCMVTDADPVTDEDVAKLKRFHNGTVSTGSDREWYALLRETQGDPEAILEAGIAVDAGNFPSDSLFCEWGYLIDLDADIFEVYRGFQEEPHNKGRFSDRVVEDEHRQGRTQYQPVKLIASWPLDALPSDIEFAGVEEASEEE